MITQSHPSAEVRRQSRPRIGTAWIFAVAVSLILAAAALVDNLDAQPWVHPDCPTERC